MWTTALTNRAKRVISKVTPSMQTLKNLPTNAVNSSYNLSLLTFRLNKYALIFIKDLGKIAVGYGDGTTTRTQQFAELVAKDFTKRLNAIMVYMKYNDSDKKNIVNNIKKILDEYALKPLPTPEKMKIEDNNASTSGTELPKTAGRKRKTKKNRRY